MLVLTRKQNEKIRIGENITITVIRMKGKAVRLGIDAPKEINVLRGELLFDAANDAANAAANDDAADIHCESVHSESSKVDQSTEDTIIECRIPRAEHEPFTV
jgi:carbon storage regulator CsrA